MFVITFFCRFAKLPKNSDHGFNFEYCDIGFNGFCFVFMLRLSCLIFLFWGGKKFSILFFDLGILSKGSCKSNILKIEYF